MKQKKNSVLPKNNKNTISFSLRGFKILRYSILEPGLDTTQGFDIKNLKFGFNIDFATNLEHNGFQITLTLVYHYNLNGKDIQLLEFIFLTDFIIKDLLSIVVIDKENINIPHELLVNLTSIAYSSARGVIFAKTQGSFLNQFILPVIDPHFILEQKFSEKQSIAEKKQNMFNRKNE